MTYLVHQSFLNQKHSYTAGDCPPILLHPSTICLVQHVYFMPTESFLIQTNTPLLLVIAHLHCHTADVSVSLLGVDTQGFNLHE